MAKSTTIGALAKAMNKVQSALRPAAKTADNPFFKSRYADLPTCWENCRAVLGANGLSLCQSVEIEGGATYLVSLLMHESGEWIDGRYPIKPIKDDPQSLGSAVTYARRYALCAMVGIVADDDDDGNAASGRVEHQPEREPIHHEERNERPVVFPFGHHKGLRPDEVDVQVLQSDRAFWAEKCEEPNNKFAESNRKLLAAIDLEIAKHEGNGKAFQVGQWKTEVSRVTQALTLAEDLATLQTTWSSFQQVLKKMKAESPESYHVCEQHKNEMKATLSRGDAYEGLDPTDRSIVEQFA